ncbi:MAG: VPLPA-CTERM sorting domain-containing protein [Gammaproteobacteria bacterium]
MHRAILLLTILAALPASADSVRVIATGLVESVDDPNGKLVGFADLTPGVTQFTLQFDLNFDAFEFPVFASDEDIGFYGASMSDVSLTGGGQTLSFLGDSFTLIFNDRFDSVQNWYSEFWLGYKYTPEENDPPGTEFGKVSLLTAGGYNPANTELLTSAALVAPFLDPAWIQTTMKYEIARTEILQDGAGTPNEVSLGNVTIQLDGITVVPLPAAVWLFGSGLLIVGKCGRRRKTS